MDRAGATPANQRYLTSSAEPCAQVGLRRRSIPPAALVFVLRWRRVGICENWLTARLAEHLIGSQRLGVYAAVAAAVAQIPNRHASGSRATVLGTIEVIRCDQT